MDFVVNTVAEVGDAYLQWLIKQKKSAHHVSAVKRCFDELAELEGCGDLPLEKLSIGYFKNWYRHCRQKVEVEGRQATWANKRMVIVKAAFTRCQREGWMAIAMPDLNQMLGVLQQHAGSFQQQEIFSPAELRSVLKAGTLQDRAAILVALNCAIGNADMGRLKWGDFVQRTLGNRTEYIFEQARGKTQRRRRTPLWPLTADIFEKWREHCRKKGVATDSSNFTFTTNAGTPVVSTGLKEEAKLWRHDALSRRLDSILKKLKIKRERLAWYSLRHTAATWATDFAEDHSLVGEGNQFLLGQASDAMWKTYSKGVPPAVRKAVEAIWRGLNDGEALVLDPPPSDAEQKDSAA